MFFIPEIYAVGGAERVITILANYLAGHGHSVQILTIRDGNPYYDIDERVVIKGMVTRECKIPIFRTILIPYYWKNMAMGFAKHVNDFNADIVVSFLYPANNIAILSRRITNAAVVVSERNDPMVAGSKIERKINARLYPKADIIVCQGEKVSSYYTDLFGKCIVLPNPLKSDAVGQYVPEKKNRIVSVGRLAPHKNHRLLIEAFAKIHDKHQDCTLSIVGEGAQREQLEKQISYLKLQGWVTIHHNMRNVMTKVNDSACFVLPSDYEGMPNVLIEAMASGMPVVSTDFGTGIARELIKDGENGYIVPVGDVNRMALAIDKIVSSRELQGKMGRANLKVREQFDENIICARWEKTLMNIVSRNA